MSRAVASVEPFFQLSLLGLVASGFLAVAGSGYLDVPTLALTGAGLLLRAAMVTGFARFEIPDRWITILTIAYIGFYPLDFQFLSGEFLPATVHLVFFLAVMKILTARTNRDYLYTAAISMLELLAAALISVQLNFFLFLGAYLLFAVAALTSAEIRRAAAHAGQIARFGVRRPIGRRLAVLTALVTGGVLALTACLFFLLPRTAHAALRQLAARGYYMPGFSNEVTLGQIGEIKMRSSAVMHVRFDSKDGRIRTRWRGAALAHFDGRKWTDRSAKGTIVPIGAARIVILESDEQRHRRGTRILYRVDLKPMDTDALFFAGTPEVLTINADSVIRTPAGGYRLGMGATDGLRYEVQAFLEDERTPFVPRLSDLPADERTAYLQLPRIDGRIPVLAREITAGGTDAYRLASELERHLRINYRYTTQLLRRDVPDPLAYFLFDRREGHCEYYASAMTVMLRTLGVPARLATGFQGGTFNPVSGLYVVRTSDAHSWVEAWIPGRGWTAFDPTPPDPRPRYATLWNTVSMYFDAADTFWQDWVVSYDLGRQLLLADRMERSAFGLDWISRDRFSAAFFTDARDWVKRYSGWLGIAVTTAGALMFAVPVAWRRLRLRLRVRRLRQGQATGDDATMLYLRFLELLRQRGHSKPAWFTPSEFVRTLRQPRTVELAGQFTSAYQALRFGGKVEAAPRLSLLLDEIEALPK